MASLSEGESTCRPVSECNTVLADRRESAMERYKAALEKIANTKEHRNGLGLTDFVPVLNAEKMCSIAQEALDSVRV